MEVLLNDEALKVEWVGLLEAGTKTRHLALDLSRSFSFSLFLSLSLSFSVCPETNEELYQPYDVSHSHKAYLP